MTFPSGVMVLIDSFDSKTFVFSDKRDGKVEWYNISVT